MDYQQRKMAIDQIILQHQRDIMAIDQQTLQLQNERFQLLDSLLASSCSSTAPLTNQQLLTPAAAAAADDTNLATKVAQPQPNSPVARKKKKTKKRKRSASMVAADEASVKRPKKDVRFEDDASDNGNNEMMDDNSPVDMTDEIVEKKSRKHKSLINPSKNVKTDEEPPEMHADSSKKLSSIENVLQKCRVVLKRMNVDDYVKMQPTKIETVTLASSSSPPPPAPPAPVNEVTTNVSDNETKPECTDEIMISSQSSAEDCFGFSTPQLKPEFQRTASVDFDGRFVGHKMPITYLQVICRRFFVCFL